MTLSTAVTVLKYAAVALVVLCLGGVAGWYLFLHSREQATTAESAARGLPAPVPSFNGTEGSSAANASAVSGAPTVFPLTPPGQGQQLWEVDNTPVAGFGFATTTALGTSTDLYFAERGNGNVFDADPATNIVTRLTDTLYPKTYEAIFDGTDVLLRGIDDSGNITTFAGSFQAVSTSSQPQTLSGVDLAPGIASIAVDPHTDGLLYLTGSGATGITGTTDTWSDSERAQVFTSAIADWEVLYAGGGFMLLEKPADGVTGYAYRISDAGDLTLVEGPLPGLTIQPDPAEGALIFGTSSGSGLSLYTQVGSAAPVLLSINTIADKCAWEPGESLVAYCAVPTSAPSGDFLDEWYQGTTHTSDSIWQIDAASGTAQEIYTPPIALDVEDPVVDPTGNYLAFENAIDQSLWVLRIAQ